MFDPSRDNQVFFRDMGVDLTLWPDTEDARNIEKGGLLDSEFYEMQAGGRIGTFASDPKLTCLTENVAGLKQGDEVEIHPAPHLCVPGGRFSVVSNQPDGTGFSLVELHT
jgi:hypothetical protein